MMINNVDPIVFVGSFFVIYIVIIYSLKCFPMRKIL
jgi:hypothetical protein